MIAVRKHLLHPTTLIHTNKVQQSATISFATFRAELQRKIDEKKTVEDEQKRRKEVKLIKRMQPTTNKGRDKKIEYS